MFFDEGMAMFFPVSHNSSDVWIQREQSPQDHIHWLFSSPSVVAPLTRKAYTDYKLEKELAHLFPDFYYQFLENFSRESFLHATYCKYGYRGLEKMMFDRNKSNEQTKAKIVSDFANAFRNSLGSTFDEMCKENYFTQKFIQCEFLPYLSKLRPHFPDHYKIREAEVIAKAIKGDHKPYIWFLKAYGYTDEEVWDLLYPHIIKRCLIEEGTTNFQDIFSFFKKKDDNLLNNVRGFIR